MSKTKAIRCAALGVLVLMSGLAGCTSEQDAPSGSRGAGPAKAHASNTPATPARPHENRRSYSGKKVLFVDSYHADLDWSASLIRGARDVLDETEVELKVISLDTKRNPSEEFKAQAAQRGMAVIAEFEPDVVIASDDNASKYLIMPHFKNAELPFVFCGVNWDASAYGFPFGNVTGMIEVALTSDLIRLLRTYAKGSRVGFLGPDVLTRRKDVKNMKSKLGIEFTKVVFVETQAQWEEAFKSLQETVDVLLLAQTGGINDWNDNTAKAFVRRNTKIPTGADEESVAPLALVGLTKIGEEQGQWAANAALRILSGTSPAAIPIETNKRGRLYINMAIADQMGVVFELDVLEEARVLK